MDRAQRPLRSIHYVARLLHMLFHGGGLHLSLLGRRKPADVDLSGRRRMHCVLWYHYAAQSAAGRPGIEMRQCTHHIVNTRRFHARPLLVAGSAVRGLLAYIGLLKTGRSYGIAAHPTSAPKLTPRAVGLCCNNGMAHCTHQAVRRHAQEACCAPVHPTATMQWPSFGRPSSIGLWDSALNMVSIRLFSAVSM